MGARTALPLWVDGMFLLIIYSVGCFLLLTVDGSDLTVATQKKQNYVGFLYFTCVLHYIVCVCVCVCLC